MMAPTAGLEGLSPEKRDIQKWVDGACYEG